MVTTGRKQKEEKANHENEAFIIRLSENYGRQEFIRSIQGVQKRFLNFIFTLYTIKYYIKALEDPTPVRGGYVYNVKMSKKEYYVLGIKIWTKKIK